MFSVTQMSHLLADYDRFARSVRMRLLDRYHAKLVWGVSADTRLEIARLIPKIPDIGRGNVWQFKLDTSVMILAMYRAMKKYGCSLPETVQIIYDIFEAYLTSYPVILRRVYSQYYFSQIHRDYLQRGAIRSQLRQHPDDWVFTFLDGDGVAFDFGTDISECAIMKFYGAQNGELLTHCVCQLDHALGKLLGLGLQRQNTLANGAAICDCRWKHGAETPSWPPIAGTVLQNLYSK